MNIYCKSTTYIARLFFFFFFERNMSSLTYCPVTTFRISSFLKTVVIKFQENPVLVYAFNQIVYKKENIQYLCATVYCNF